MDVTLTILLKNFFIIFDLMCYLTLIRLYIGKYDNVSMYLYCEFDLLLNCVAFQYLLVISFMYFHVSRFHLWDFTIRIAALLLIFLPYRLQNNRNMKTFPSIGLYRSFFIMSCLVLNFYYLITSLWELPMQSPLNLILYMILQYIFWISLSYALKEQKTKSSAYRRSIQRLQLAGLKNELTNLKKDRHEFKNILSVIRLLCNEKPDIAVHKISNYLNQILDSSYVGDSLDCNTGSTLINGLLCRLKKELHDKNIDLQIEVEYTFDFWYIDEYRLYTALSNVIRNASEALESGNKQDYMVINVLFFKENNVECISVSNNGPMISVKPIEKIFECGFTTKDSPLYEHGFGLYITKRIIQTLGGDITAHSDKFSTEVLISFPCKNYISKEENKKLHA